MTPAEIRALAAKAIAGLHQLTQVTLGVGCKLRAMSSSRALHSPYMAGTADYAASRILQALAAPVGLAGAASSERGTELR
jgi:hypothetical protein